MILFLTSSPCTNDMPEGVELPCILNEDNGFVEQLKKHWKPDIRCLIISADPTNYGMNDEMADTFFGAFSYHGLTLSDMVICDDRNAGEIAAFLKESDVIILAGGHVPTQMEFFDRLGLRELIQEFTGIVIGISAGTMNSADIVYAQPELPGESEDPEYERFLQGLGLTKTMILPHYQMVKDNELDGKRLYEDITYGDSYGKRFLVLPDGSYLLRVDGKESIWGEAWEICDGKMNKICEDRESRAY